MTTDQIIKLIGTVRDSLIVEIDYGTFDRDDGNGPQPCGPDDAMADVTQETERLEHYNQGVEAFAAAMAALVRLRTALGA